VPIRVGYNGSVNVSPIRLRVKELRTVRGWSQEDLSSKAKVRQATISDMETGKAKSVDLALLERLAAAFEVDAGYLFVTVPEEPKPRRRQPRGGRD